ncbi:hypothetical protein AKJ16_DCAP14012 [Drosera capensis]
MMFLSRSRHHIHLEAHMKLMMVSSTQSSTLSKCSFSTPKSGAAHHSSGDEDQKFSSVLGKGASGRKQN